MSRQSLFVPTRHRSTAPYQPHQLPQQFPTKLIKSISSVKNNILCRQVFANLRQTSHITSRFETSSSGKNPKHKTHAQRSERINQNPLRMKRLHAFQYTVNLRSTSPSTNYTTTQQSYKKTKLLHEWGESQGKQSEQTVRKLLARPDDASKLRREIHVLVHIIRLQILLHLLLNHFPQKWDAIHLSHLRFHENTFYKPLKTHQHDQDDP